MKKYTIIYSAICAILIGGFASVLCLSSRQCTPLDIKPSAKTVSENQDGEAKIPLTDALNAVIPEDNTNCIDINAKDDRDVVFTGVQTVEARMQEQMQLAFAAFGIDPKSEIVEDTKEEGTIFKRTMRAITLRDGKYLTFDTISGQLLHYLSFIQEEAPNRLTKQDAISQEKATTIARQILEILDVGDSFSFEKVYYNKDGDALDSGNSDSLTGAEWSFHGSQKYEGIPYFSSGIHIRVSAYSGIILAYVNDPMGPLPVSLEERITADEASSIASDFLGIGFWGLLNGVHVRPATKVIACSNTYFSSPGKRPIVQGTESHLCWQVIVENYNDFPLTIIVNAATGEIIGGI